MGDRRGGGRERGRRERIGRDRGVKGVRVWGLGCGKRGKALFESGNALFCEIERILELGFIFCHCFGVME